MRRKAVWLVFICLILAITGCTQLEQVEDVPAMVEQNKQPVEDEPEEADASSEIQLENLPAANSGQQVAVKQQEVYEVEEMPEEGYNWDIDMDFIRYHLQLGLLQEEVIALFGHRYAEVKDAMDDRQVWRYDFTNHPDYHYTAFEGLDSADIDGLFGGMMKMQLFISWTDEGLMSSFSSLYAGADGGVYEYRVMEDGTIKEGSI